jgi:hypothetical protein
MVTKVSSGQQTALRAEAKAAPAATSGMSVGVAMQPFTIHFRGSTLSYARATRFIAEPALKSFIQSNAADADVVWES